MATRQLNAADIKPSIKDAAVLPKPSATGTVISQITITPTIHEIMASQIQLQKGIYTDQNGRQFHVNAAKHVQIANLNLEMNQDLCLIDKGSNNGIAGVSMHEYECAEVPETVDIVGPSNMFQ